MNKKIDVSVLPNGFLIEVPTRGISGAHTWSIKRMNSLSRTYAGFGDYRPALNVWHYNNGSMVLPDGLVVDVEFRDSSEYVGVFVTRLRGVCGEGSGVELSGDFSGGEYLGMTFSRNYEVPEYDIIAVKIIGVTAEYGAQLGMEVIEL